ncbi:hypothetical protein MAR_032303 [Mya arenaria]|uniref:Ig-like domain-containing protein n=1 Tax=Mya arenaria TaxID=6604 RepID=A0ABY7F6X2_MYAAR|nr:hypothetical protein MAR_032274 [Mya arenaria]WAR17689.1 hypothetical protein MAR_032283 [Mya arenaria]WAR17709.1 hypothetical protein MAR_032303 [Mya arenaria]
MYANLQTCIPAEMDPATTPADQNPRAPKATGAPTIAETPASLRNARNGSRNEIPISNISLITEKEFVTVSEKESVLVQCVCHGGIPAGHITWFYDNGTPADVSDDAILTEINNETITQLDNTVTTQSYVAIKAATALIGTSLYCKASNDNVNWLFILPSSVKVTHPRTQFVTAYEDKSVCFECVTSPGCPALSITWYKVTNGSEVITSADSSSTTEMEDRTIVTRSWVSLTFSISDDWTFVYCTASNSAGTLTSINRAAVHVHKITENFKTDNSHYDSTLAKTAIGLSSITGTSLVFFIVGCLIFMKLRSSKAVQREHTHDSGHVNQANDQGKDNTSSRINLKASAGNISYTTLQMYENTTFREPYEPMQMAGDS